jgi:transcriptional regulator with XRE-family HTH domain
MIEDPNGAALGGLSARIEYLFDKIRPSVDELTGTDEVGRRYTNKEIADRINAKSGDSGVSISAAYIGELRRGIALDPRASHIRALAQAFGVNPAYFVDDAAARRVQEQIDLLNDLRRMDVRQVALRHVLRDTGLSEASATLVEQMVARLSAIETAATPEARTEPAKRENL